MVLKQIQNNFHSVATGNLTVWFSYETPIAYQPGAGAPVVRENDWGPTTGKHLAHIDGGSAEAKKARVPARAFERALTSAKGF